MNDVRDRIDRYFRFAFYKSNGYYIAANSYGRYSVLLGVVAILFGASAGTTAFGDIFRDSPIQAPLIGVLAVLAAVFSSLQTFLKFAEKSEKLRAAAATFEQLHHRLDILRLRAAEMATRAEVIEEFEKIVEQADKAAATNPTLPDRFYDRAHARGVPDWAKSHPDWEEDRPVP